VGCRREIIVIFTPDRWIDKISCAIKVSDKRGYPFTIIASSLMLVEVSLGRNFRLYLVLAGYAGRGSFLATVSQVD
jgi:hypothetical protein